MNDVPENIINEYIEKSKFYITVYGDMDYAVETVTAVNENDKVLKKRCETGWKLTGTFRDETVGRTVMIFERPAEMLNKKLLETARKILGIC
ncbi:MAG: hypothetical protein NC177_08120 [Ruminococcus flavefaciens]|nr:hypothetical protein [Ruminococcus flavefaciens]